MRGVCVGGGGEFLLFFGLHSERERERALRMGITNHREVHFWKGKKDATRRPTLKEDSFCLTMIIIRSQWLQLNGKKRFFFFLTSHERDPLRQVKRNCVMCSREVDGYIWQLLGAPLRRGQALRVEVWEGMKRERERGLAPWDFFSFCKSRIRSNRRIRLNSFTCVGITTNQFY